MSRNLIDRDALIELIDGGFDLDFDEVPETKRELIRMVREQPLVDAVEVVRCKDCKHRDPESHKCDCAGHEMLMGGFIPMPDNWFCADGERRCND